MEGLGRLFDIGCGITPVDTQTGAMTGKRIHLSRATGVTAVFFKGAGSGTDNPVLTLRQHTAGSGGTSANLVAGVKFYSKSAATLAGTEQWVATTQAASAVTTLTGEAQHEGIYVWEISGASLSDGYAWFSVDIADTGSAGAQLGCLFYVLHDLEVQRSPVQLANPQA